MSDSEKKINEMIVNEMIDESQEEGIWELETDDGTVGEFYLLAILEYKKEWYVLFEPVEEVDEMQPGEAIIFKLESNEEDDEDIFLPVEDEEALEAVFNEYLKMCEEDDESEEE